MTFTIDACYDIDNPNRPTGFHAFADFDSEAEAEGVRARLPKMLKLKVGRLFCFNGETKFSVSMRVAFRSTSDNPKNEAGARRVRRFLTECGAHKYRASYGNSFPTLDAFLSTIDSPPDAPDPRDDFL